MKGLLFTYVLTYGGATVSLFNPFVGLLVYVCFAVMRPEALWWFSVPVGNYSRIVALSLLVGWVLNGFGSWRFGRGRAVFLAFVAYFGWAVVCAQHAADQTIAWHFVEELAKVILPFAVGLTTIDSVRKLKLLVWVIVLSQGFVAFEFNLSYYAGFNRVILVSFAGMEEGSISMGMVACAGLALFLGMHSEKWWQRALAFASAGLMAHVPLFSFSRSGMLGLIATGVAAFLIIPKKPRHYFILTAAVLLMLRLAGPQVRERLSTSFVEAEKLDGSAQSRLVLWSNCIDAMLKRPLFGIGPDHFPLIVNEYGWEKGKEGHSLWLQIGAELGIPGLTFLALTYLSCIGRLWPLTRERTWVADLWLRGAARMVIASLAGFMVAAQFISLEGLEIPYYVALVGAAALKLSSVPMRPEVADSAEPMECAG